MDPKKFWSFLSNIKGTSGIPSQLIFNGETLSTPIKIVVAFADHFNVNYIKSNSSPSLTDNLIYHIISFGSVSEDQVLSALKKIKPKSTTGPDGIPAFLLPNCAATLAFPLSVIFNLALKTSDFPSTWKNSYITPVHKKGDKYDVSNYRPISLICNFTKTFEFILHEYLFTKVCNHLSNCQHGFFLKRSTISNLCCFTQFSAECIDERKQVDVIYTDFSKAFDRLDHNILLSKLHSFGFSASLLTFFKSYLTGRKQYVFYKGFKSKEIIPTSGVPQGSVLGPLFFSIFINDIVNGLSSLKLLFADDFKLYREISTISDCVLLQDDLLKLSRWCHENKLHLNLNKCTVMSITHKINIIEFEYRINNVKLARVQSVVDLGITFDNKLSFVPHINVVVAKAFQALGFIIRCSMHFRNIDTLKLLYCAYVRSKLEYGSIIWDPSYQRYVDKVETIQHRFLKFLAFKTDGVYPERGYSQQNLLKIFFFLDLQTRRRNFSMNFLKKLIKYKIDCPDLLSQISLHVPNKGTRQSRTFYISTPRTNVLKFSPLHQMCTYYNESQDNDIFK
jgi:hypothetical protein